MFFTPVFQIWSTFVHNFRQKSVKKGDQIRLKLSDVFSKTVHLFCQATTVCARLFVVFYSVLFEGYTGMVDCATHWKVFQRNSSVRLFKDKLRNFQSEVVFLNSVSGSILSQPIPFFSRDRKKVKFYTNLASYSQAYTSLARILQDDELEFFKT